MARINNISLDDLATGSMLFDLSADPGETRNLAGTSLEAELAGRLRDLMEAQGGPSEQFERLGLR
jgi:hypothetical protein